jgi:endonuclease YncB( thermonuclease family)
MARKGFVWLLGAFLFGAIGPAEAARVVGVIDGDLIRVEEAGKVREVHVAGVDAPNAARPKKGAEYFGREAADFAQKSLLGLEVRLTRASTSPKEHYVELAGGGDLGTELVRRGLAYAQPACSRCKELEAEERKARRAFAGLWNSNAYTQFQANRNTQVQYMGITGESRGVRVDYGNYHDQTYEAVYLIEVRVSRIR